MNKEFMNEPTELQKAIEYPLPMKSAKEWVKSLGNREARNLFANSPALMLDFIETVQKDAINSTDNHAKQLAAMTKDRDESRAKNKDLKWELSEMHEQRRQFEQQLSTLKSDYKQALDKLKECFKHLGREIQHKSLNESSTDGTQKLSREIAALLDGPSAIAIMKGQDEK